MQGTVAGRVRLGTESMLSAHVLPPLYRRIRAEFPSVELAVVTGTTTGLSKALVGGELDRGGHTAHVGPQPRRDAVLP
jgi:DNA-binding transcriptional LysR family regulator